MQTSQAGFNLIKEFEGCRLHAYPDPATGGEPWTIGYGWAQNVKPGDVWTQEKAEAMLIEGVKPFEAAVRKVIGQSKTTQHQFDAMVCFCYNVGPANFEKSSVAREHIAGNYKNAAEAFLRWNKAAGKVMAGLTRRREAEKRLYLSATI